MIPTAFIPVLFPFPKNGTELKAGPIGHSVTDIDSIQQVSQLQALQAARQAELSQQESSFPVCSG